MKIIPKNKIIDAFELAFENIQAIAIYIENNDGNLKVTYEQGTFEIGVEFPNDECCYGVLGDYIIFTKTEQGDIKSYDIINNELFHETYSIVGD